MMGRLSRRKPRIQTKKKKGGNFFAPPDSKSFFQARKLAVNSPNDKYEKEADAVANAVVSEQQSPAIQEKEISAVQRDLATPEKEEKMGTAEERLEEDKLVQEMPENEEEEMVQAQEDMEEEEMVQAQEDMEEEEMVQAQEMTEEEELQTKPAAGVTPSAVSGKIVNKRGKGKPMSGQVKKKMESAFHRDFSEVSIHDDQDAHALSKKLSAQAFTHGKDIFFGDGKYRPESAEGQRLIAHELTHVVQQKKAKK